MQTLNYNGEENQSHSEIQEDQMRALSGLNGMQILNQFCQMTCLGGADHAASLSAPGFGQRLRLHHAALQSLCWKSEAASTKPAHASSLIMKEKLLLRISPHTGILPFEQIGRKLNNKLLVDIFKNQRICWSSS